MNLLIESQYLPPIATFSILKNIEELQLDVHSYYVKGSYRNRCVISGANGAQRLSVPLVKGKHQKTLLKNVLISYDENWRKDHWQSIISTYNRSPYFDYYKDEFEELLFANYTKLIDLNFAFFQWLLTEFNLPVTLTQTINYMNEVDLNTKDFRNIIHPIEKKNIVEVEYKHYEQIFSNKLPFIPNLSSIDLLFSKGPEGIEYL